MIKFEAVKGHLAIRKVSKDGEFKGYVRISKRPYFYRGRKQAIYAISSTGLGLKGGLKFCLEFMGV